MLSYPCSEGQIWRDFDLEHQAPSLAPVCAVFAAYQTSLQHPDCLHGVQHSCNHIVAIGRICAVIRYKIVSQGIVVAEKC